MTLLFKYLKPYLFFTIIAPAFMLLEVFMDLQLPAQMAGIVDSGIKSGSLAVILSIGSKMLIVAVIGLAGGIGCAAAASYVSTNLGADLRENLFAHIQTLTFKDLETLKSGNLITLLTNDVIQLEDVTGMMLRIMVRAPLQVIGSFIMALIISPSLSLVLFILSPLLTVSIIMIIRKSYPLFNRVQSCLDHVNTTIQENLAGRRLVKTFVREARETEKFGQANNALVDTAAVAAKRVALIHPAMQIILNLGIVIVLWAGGRLVADSALPIGKLIAFINYLTQLLWSLMMISNILMRFSRAQVSAARIREVFNRIPGTPPAGAREGCALKKAGLEFANVSFAYDGNLLNPVLKDISFTAEPGSTVAILGATGSGKSTLAHLIPGFYAVSGGAILLNGMDINSLHPETLRKNTGIVFQQTILFRGTIRKNILYSQDTSAPYYMQAEGDERMHMAAKTAMIADFIETLPGKYDTDINQRGLNLSGGQKQRIAIARAIAAAAPILILDDATSSVDVATELAIHAALKQVLPGQTRIVIAQRISTVLSADLILILENGKLAGAGTHKELLAGNPVYRDIYASQYGNLEAVDGA